MASNSKGVRAERKLASWLGDNGFAVIRAPASGSATDRELPDLFAGDGRWFLAIEVKRSSSKPIYIDQSKIDGLAYFAEKFGASTRVAVKFDLKPDDDAYGSDRPGFWFLAPLYLHRTPGGNYRVKKSEAHELGTREVDLL